MNNSDIIFYGNLNNKNIQGYAYSVYGINGLSATITTGCGGWVHTVHIGRRYVRDRENG